MKSSLNDAFWTKVSIDSKKWWNTIQIIEMSAGIRNCAPSEIDHIIFELVNFDVSKIFVSYRVFYELMVNCPPQSTKWLIPPRAGIQINILQQYIDIANININIGFSKIAISISLLNYCCQYIANILIEQYIANFEQYIAEIEQYIAHFLVDEKIF